MGCCDESCTDYCCINGNYTCDDTYYGTWCVGDDNYISGGYGDFTLTEDCKYVIDYPAIYIKEGDNPNYIS